MDIEALVTTATQMLGSLRGWMAKAATTAEERGEGPDNLLSQRLAPDMFPLEAQIFFAAYQAQAPLYRLRGEALPSALEDLQAAGWASGERTGTWANAEAKVDDALRALQGVDFKMFENSQTRPVELSLPTGMIFDLDGAAYIRDWALPQFYFHLVTSYAILRHNGVPLGKPDYVPHMLAYVRGGTG